MGEIGIIYFSLNFYATVSLRGNVKKKNMIGQFNTV
jgi:hypothetical protein